MNVFRLFFWILLLSQTGVAQATDCGQPISVAAVKSLSGTVTLGDLATKFGMWCQGHGPVSWYRGANGKEVWFWWKLPKQAATTDAEGMQYQVLMAFEVLANDPDAQQIIIWPAEFVGKNICDVFKENGQKCRK
jgi:hypothetical protein